MILIKLIDENADGNGTNIETLICINNVPNPKTIADNKIVQKVEKAILDYKISTNFKYQTDELTNVAIKTLKDEGYEAEEIYPTSEIYM